MQGVGEIVTSQRELLCNDQLIVIRRGDPAHQIGRLERCITALSVCTRVLYEEKNEERRRVVKRLVKEVSEAVEGLSHVAGLHLLEGDEDNHPGHPSAEASPVLTPQRVERDFEEYWKSLFGEYGYDGVLAKQILYDAIVNHGTGTLGFPVLLGHLQNFPAPVDEIFMDSRLMEANVLGATRRLKKSDVGDNVVGRSLERIHGDDILSFVSSTSPYRLCSISPAVEDPTETSAGSSASSASAVQLYGTRHQQSLRSHIISEVEHVMKAGGCLVAECDIETVSGWESLFLLKQTFLAKFLEELLCEFQQKSFVLKAVFEESTSYYSGFCALLSSQKIHVTARRLLRHWFLQSGNGVIWVLTQLILYGTVSSRNLPRLACNTATVVYMNGTRIPQPLQPVYTHLPELAAYVISTELSMNSMNKVVEGHFNAVTRKSVIGQKVVEEEQQQQEAMLLDYVSHLVRLLHQHVQDQYMKTDNVTFNSYDILKDYEVFCFEAWSICMDGASMNSKCFDYMAQRKEAAHHMLSLYAQFLLHPYTDNVMMKMIETFGLDIDPQVGTDSLVGCDGADHRPQPEDMQVSDHMIQTFQEWQRMIDVLYRESDTMNKY